MKVPLRYQVSETDCGIITILNAINYIYEREEIDPELMGLIVNYSEIIRINEENKSHRYGMTKYAIKHICDIMNEYSKTGKMKINARILSYENLTILDDSIINCIKNGGAVVIRVWQEYEHYSVLTDIDDEYAYIFDPYYLDKNEYDMDEDVEIVEDQIFKYNRKVKISRLNSDTKKDFALVQNSNRGILIINR